MEKEDARKLSPAEQHERRRQVVRAFKRGRTRAQIAEDVGLSYTAVGKIIALFESSGLDGLAPRTRGRRAGEDRALTPEQEALIHQTITHQRPRQVKLDFALWSRPAVQQLIERECGVALHVRSVGKYLARWGFKPQKTVKATARPSAAAAANTGVQRRRVAPRAEPPAASVVVDAPPIP